MPRRSRKAKQVAQRGREQVRSSPAPTLSRRAAWLCCAGVFLALFLIYLRTLLPTAVDQDSGELVAAVHTQGIPHPTGYPLWLLLGRLFDYLPLGHTSAYRVGMLSSVAGAAAGALITLIALNLTGQALSGVFAGLAFGLWFPCWSQSVRAEVYAISALLFAIALLAFRRWHRAPSARALLWLSLACGFVSMHHRTAFLAIAPAFLAAFLFTPPRARTAYLALSWLLLAGIAVSQLNQGAMGMMGVLFLLILIYALIRRLSLRTHLAAVALFLAPFSLYLYLMWRAIHHPAINWTNPTTLDRLLYHVLGKQYFGFALSNDFGRMVYEGNRLLPQTLLPTAGLAVLLAVVGVPLIVWGAITWWRRQLMVAATLFLGSALLVFWVLKWGETTDLKVFLSPLGEVVALCGALALANVRTAVHSPPLARAATAAAGMLICGLQLGGNWSRADLSDEWTFRDEWACALVQMEPNAIFVSDQDVPSFMTMYLQNVEGLRKDVTLIRTVGVMQPWYRDLISDPELRSVLQESWRQTSRQLGVTDSRSPEFHQGTRLLAHLLAKRYRGRRPVYVLYGLNGPIAPMPGPPHFVSLSEDLVVLAFEPPISLVSATDETPLAEFHGLGRLRRFQWGRTEAANGELVGFTADWQLDSELPPVEFSLGLLPGDMSLDQFGALLAVEPAQHLRLVQPFPLVYGQWRFVPPAADERSGKWQLDPSPPGTAYRQSGAFIIPSNLPPGTYRIAVTTNHFLSTDYHGWVEVGAIRVIRRSLPRNGP